MKYTVVIEKRHCVGTKYMDTNNCPLCTAIREQLPNFPLESVAGTYIRDRKNNIWDFDSSYATGWNSARLKQIFSEEVKEYKVTFRNDNVKSSKEMQPEKPQEKIRYVAVSETIKEQKKELILN